MRRQEERRGEPTEAVSRPTGRRLDTVILEDASEFASLEGEWGELYESCPRATPFQSWAWLYTWWEFYGEGYELRLAAVRAGGLLVGLLPLMVRRGLGFGPLLLLGGDETTPYKDVLIREGWEDRVAEAGARALERLSGWRVADLQDLRPEAAAWDIFRKWKGPRTSVETTPYVLIHAKRWEELLASLSSNARSLARKTLRRLEEDGVRYEPADLDGAQEAARRLVALHRELWLGRDIAPEHLTPRYAAFMEAVARRMTARGIGRVSEFRREGTVIVSHFLVFDKGYVGACVVGASQQAARRYQFNTLAIWDALNVARSRSSQYVDLMEAASGDKLRWADDLVMSYRAIMGRRLIPWIPYAGYHLLCSGVLGYVNSGRAPWWIRSVVHRYWEFLDGLRYRYARRRARREMHEKGNKINTFRAD
jgi:CelD/BcsL family acetyltransferase involved in cellulose biosynthesis